MRALGAGLLLAVLVAALAGWIWGVDATVGAAVFGVLAAVIHAAAIALLKPVLEPPFDQALKRWAYGVGLRLVGVAILAVLLLRGSEVLQPVPSAVGFLGVMVPLMMDEMRLLLIRVRTGK